MKPVRLLGVDPGATTGVAIVDYTKDQREVMVYGEVPLWEDLDTLMDVHKPMLIVIEAFRLYRHKAMAQVGSDFPSSQVIGVVRYLADHRGLTVVQQGASEIKTATKPDKDYSSSHVRDALRHCDLLVMKLRQAARTKKFPDWYEDLLQRVVEHDDN